MKKSWKKWILILLMMVVLICLSTIAYFYFALSGNPFVMWSHKHAIVELYENRHAESFIVTSSSYDYKRGEYEVELSPKLNPDIKFKTSLSEADRVDLYGRARSIKHIKDQVLTALSSTYTTYEYSFNVYEDYTSPGVLETDLMTRLSQNRYVVSFSFDVASINSEALDELFSEIQAKIAQSLSGQLNNMTIRFSAYDGTNYYHAEYMIIAQ